MRILWDFSNSDVGGALTSLENFVKSMSVLANGKHFHLLVSRVPIDGRVDFNNVEWVKVSKRSKLEKLKYLILKLPRLARSKNVDTIVYSGALPSPFVGSPFAFFVRQALYFSKEKSIKSAKERIILKLKKSVLKRAAKKALVILVQTSFMRDEVIRAFKPKCRVEVVTWNPIQESDEMILRDRIEKEPRDSKLRILYVSLPTGRPYKNHEKLIRAFHICLERGLDAELVLTCPEVGESNDLTENSIFSTIDELDLRKKITLTGILSHEDTLRLYRKADVFCFPSNHESFGVPLLEAMVAGLPILASDTPVIREVTYNCGIYFDQNNSASIADAIMNSVDILDSLSKASRSVYDSHYRCSNIWEQVIKILESEES